MTPPDDDPSVGRALGSTRPRSESAGGRAAPPGVAGLRPGDWVGNFRLGPLLGKGGMGEVYLARDATLGRDVALKFIRQGRRSPDSIRRFFVEGRATASLTHPNIIVIHDLQQYDEHPYLVLELVRGRTLAERLRDGPLPPREATRLALACASALVAAHARGILHRDLKPANVMIGEDLRPRVLDFGLAQLVSPTDEPGAVEGTPAYMAPEQRFAGPLTAAVDVWALGLVLFECLTGARPDALTLLSDVREPELRREVERTLVDHREHAALITACLRVDPAARPSAPETVAALERLLGEPRGLVAPGDRCPFPGLAPYQETEAHCFGGRDAEIGELTARVLREPMTTLVGPSAVGKSSLVVAGLVPRLREQSSWRVLRARPGASPLHALAGCLADTPAAIDERAQRLREDPRSFGAALFRLAEDSRQRVLLFVDQLEELYTHPLEPAERRAFETAVVAATSRADASVRAVLTLREDFIGRAGESGVLAPALEHLMPLTLPHRGAMAEAIRGALAPTGYRFEDPALLDEMIDELAGKPGAMALLSFACRALWEARDVSRRWLLTSAYRAMGGVMGALAAEADRMLGRLGVADQRTARALLLHLVGPAGTRRVVTRDELVQGPSAERVTAALEEARLVHVATAPGEREPTVELMHEALIRSWSTLSAWVDESGEERAVLLQLTTAADLWQQRGARPEDTWSYGSVLESRARAARLAIAIPDGVERFLAATEARELRRRRRQRGVVAALAALGVVGVTAAAVFYAQAHRLRLAQADRGRFALEVEAFAWSPTGTEAAPLPPALEVRLFAPATDDPTRPGDPLIDAHLEPTGGDGAWRTYQVEARGGPAFVQVSGRGTSDAPCAPAWIPLRRMPGYAEREQTTSFRVAVPTCATSALDMIEVPAGAFVQGGLGEPPTPNTVDVAEREDASLPRFWIDRTEVTNRRFADFARLAATTGYAMPEYPDIDPVRSAGLPDRPVSKVTYRAAEAFCRFMGKRLPTVAEWEKAARGGLALDAAGNTPNPEPQRNVPWSAGAPSDPTRANLGTEADGFDGPAPVGSYPDGASPYGVLDLIGNVREWIDAPTGFMRPTRGGDWDSSPAKAEHLIAYRGQRDLSTTDYGQGFRCMRP